MQGQINTLKRVQKTSGWRGEYTFKCTLWQKVCPSHENTRCLQHPALGNTVEVFANLDLEVLQSTYCTHVCDTISKWCEYIFCEPQEKDMNPSPISPCSKEGVLQERSVPLWPYLTISLFMEY